MKQTAAKRARVAGRDRQLVLPDGHETMTALELETWLKEQERLRGRGESPAEPADPRRRSAR